jgi:hypothetical protein
MDCSRWESKEHAGLWRNHEPVVGPRSWRAQPIDNKITSREPIGFLPVEWAGRLVGAVEEEDACRNARKNMCWLPRIAGIVGVSREEIANAIPQKHWRLGAQWSEAEMTRDLWRESIHSCLNSFALVRHDLDNTGPPHRQVKLLMTGAAHLRRMPQRLLHRADKAPRRYIIENTLAKKAAGGGERWCHGCSHCISHPRSNSNLTVPSVKPPEVQGAEIARALRS